MPALALTPEAAQRQAAAKEFRKRVPLEQHSVWDAAKRTIDPTQVLLDQDVSRLPQLVGLRHARMAQSAFAFYRGSAAVMTCDLATTPTIDISVQANGDAHLANYGLFASPERRLVFDMNDFDETLTGPWEWDVKRLATSFVLAAWDLRWKTSVGARLAETAANAYREYLRGFAQDSAVDIWYASAPFEQLRREAPNKEDRKALDRVAAAAVRKTSASAVKKLTEVADGRRRFATGNPLVVPLRELEKIFDPSLIAEEIAQNMRGFTASISADRQHLLSRYQIRDVALKVVGVGSVGTRCFAVLLEGIDHGDPLLLQVKQAMPSVLTLAGLPSGYADQGHRVVDGQRQIQSASDIFLGYSSFDNEQFYYWRQLADEKGSVDVTTLDAGEVGAYARLCAWALAHAHARSGDPLAITGYLGKSTDFDKAVSAFAVSYAAQAKSDFEAWQQGIKDGRVSSSGTVSLRKVARA